MSSLVVDFAKEKEAGYQRVFARSPILSSTAAQWENLLVAYDCFTPGQTPEMSSKQHGIGIFLDLPQPAIAERTLDGQLHQDFVKLADIVVILGSIDIIMRSVDR
jgi:AraC family transcriptional regulator